MLPAADSSSRVSERAPRATHEERSDRIGDADSDRNREKAVNGFAKQRPKGLHPVGLPAKK